MDRSITVSGGEYRYEVYVPRQYTLSRAKWPVILALHGSGEYGSDGIRQTDIALADTIRRHPDWVPAVVVFPQAHIDGTPGWQGTAGRAALLALDREIEEFSGDRTRVYLTGYSAGGYGSWYLASTYPDRFAAVVIVCGFISGGRSATSGIVYPPLAPTSARDPYQEIAKRVGHVPLWMFHGDADPVIPVQEARRLYGALKEVSADVQYTELPGVGHAAWLNAYERPELYAWLFKQHQTH